MECKCSGTAPLESRQALEDLLLCLCGSKPTPVHTLEITLQGPNSSTVVLSRGMNEAATSNPQWTAQLFGLPLRGKQAVGLEASVRSVATSSCQGPEVPAFWTALGMEIEYTVERRGCAVTLHAPRSGLEVQVVVSQLYRAGADEEGGDGHAPIVPNHVLVEARALCVDGAHVETCAGLDEIRRLLRQYTTLQVVPQPPPGRRS